MSGNHFEPPLASLSLTHVYYNPDDPLSLICAWLALLPQALLVSYATLTIAQREIEIILMFSGQLACEAINWILKRCIKQHRPKQMHGKGYGMPSSHAQFVAFFAVYLALWIHLRAHAFPRWVRWWLTGAAGIGSAAVALSRIYLSYHTQLQVACGYVAGVLFAGAWFGFTSWLRRTDIGGRGGVWEALTGGRRVWEALLWVGEWGYVKDLCTQVDVVKWEWEVWKQGRLGIEEAAETLSEERKRK